VELPILERADELIAAIAAHQVVIVAGETGSGKSTQLPQFCLRAGRGVEGMIGHTQPRRIAARTIADRIAEEIGCELGTTVGYAVRFTDRVGEQTRIKVMTDGILLAEIQRDRMLRRYDTLIIDEAHERSLNIDFLLGYIRQLLPRRPDLKLIVTSATIDTQRFSEHFDDAPIITVEGRTYPVEIRYRSLGDDDETASDQVQAVCAAVDELSHEGPGDVLVFLSGEREIHDTADALRRLTLRDTEVLPLYARLSSVEQHRIFQSHRGRRIVLSTNVAETSLTVPGVRYVVDTGTARISRYSHRLKVQRLPIEPVSRASADQRAGRCGRVAPGICIRLYDEEGFSDRPAFTEPEILRTSLASVILQMTNLGLGDVAAFPFIEPPDSRSIRDGYLLLDELGALQPVPTAPKETAPKATVAVVTDRRLTKVGRQLARLPIDPRMARMVVEADRHGCVREVMVIAAALSIQDPRERPAEHRQAADEMHRRFAVDEAASSDFIAFVKLWDYLRARQQELTGNQFRRLCRSEYLNYLRVREWQDVFSQLRQVTGQLGIRAGAEAAHPDHIHQALLAGLLSHIGMRDGTADDKSRDYSGAHGSKFAIGNGSVLSRKQPKWVIAAELVETNRLWARTVASVQPEWAEVIGKHLTKYSYGEPRWEARSGRAVVGERVTLYGLPIVSNRTIGYDRVDAAEARTMFIGHALVEGDWTSTHDFIKHNAEFLDDLRSREDRTRKLDTIDDDAVIAFYDGRVDSTVVSGRHFDRWWKDARRAEPDRLTMTAEALGRASDSDADHYPTTWTQADMVFPLTYRFDPGAADDGVVVHVPLALLGRLTTDGFDWQVPGLRADLVAALMQTLPKDIRRQLIPAAETTAAAYQQLEVTDEPLAVALARAVEAVVPSVRVPPRAFDATRVADHLRMTLAVHDDTGTVVGIGKDLAELKRRLRATLRAAVARATPVDERRGITRWDVGDLPRRIDTVRGGHTVHGYPALLDDGDSVSLRVFTTAELQERVMRGGVTRLVLLAVPVGKRAVETHLANRDKLMLARFTLQTAAAIATDCITAVAERLVAEQGEVWTTAQFDALVTTARRQLPLRSAIALRTAAEIVAVAADVEEHLARLISPSVAPNVADVRRHLARLVRDHFVVAHGEHRLPDVLRHVNGINRRLDKLPESPAKDLHKLAEVRNVEREYSALLDSLTPGDIGPEVIDLGWMLEELRVSVFAPSLGTSRPVSTKRIVAGLAALRG
jgi:ATP-dependent helicase HrpA